MTEINLIQDDYHEYSDKTPVPVAVIQEVKEGSSESSSNDFVRGTPISPKVTEFPMPYRNESQFSALQGLVQVRQSLNSSFSNDSSPKTLKEISLEKNNKGNIKELLQNEDIIDMPKKKIFKKSKIKKIK